MSLVTSLVNMVSAKAPPKVSDENSHHSDSTEEAIDLKGDQFTNKEETQSLNLQSYDLIALGLTTAIGGHYFAWNAGLSAGFGSFLIALFLVSTAYYSVVLCIAELSSALPFAGKIALFDQILYSSETASDHYLNPQVAHTASHE